MGRGLGATQRRPDFRKAALIAFVFALFSSGIPFLYPTPLHAQSNTPELTVDDTRANTVTITWSDVDTATHFELWRWNGKDNAWTQLHDALTSTSYIDNGVDAGQSYHYTVRARTTRGPLGFWSDYRSLNAVAAVGSLDASTLTVDDTRPFQVHLQWTEIEGATGYELWRWQTEEMPWLQLDIDPTATSYTDRSVTAGVTYYYAVRALAEEEPHGAWSNFRLEEASATVRSSDAPPQTDGSTPTPTSTLTVTPTATPTPTFTPPPQSPPINSGPQQTSPRPTATPTPTFTPLPQSPPINRGPQQNSPRPTATSTFTPTFTPTPTSTPTPRPTSTPTPRPQMRAVGNLRVAATTTTSITLAWNPPSGPIRATSYLIVWSPVSDGSAQRAAYTTTAGYTFSGLVSNTEYFFYVGPQSSVHRVRGPDSYISASTQ